MLKRIALLSLPLVLLGVVSFKAVDAASNNGEHGDGRNRFVSTAGTDGSNTCTDKDNPAGRRSMRSPWRTRATTCRWPRARISSR